jgi:hypothetical protein
VAGCDDTARTSVFPVVVANGCPKAATQGSPSVAEKLEERPAWYIRHPNRASMPIAIGRGARRRVTRMSRTGRMKRRLGGLDTYIILQEDEAGTIPGPPPSIRAEAVGLGINCAGAVFSWAALSGEALAAPVTGGASLLLTVSTVGAAGATTLQCAAAIFRTWDATFNKGDFIRWMDSNEWCT